MEGAAMSGERGARRRHACVWLLAALSSLWFPAAAGAQDTHGPNANGLGYDRVDAAVVRIFSIGNVEVARVQGQSVARDLGNPHGGHGSGLLIDASGLIVTAKHVVTDAHVVVVRIPGDERVYPAVVVYEDPEHDVAVLRIPHGSYTTLPLPAGSVPLRVRETVDAVGYPLDPTRMHPQSSRGIIAGLLPSGELQLDMSVNPGNSGGPLLDGEGRVVGLVVARGRLDRGVEGIAVAEPLATLRAAVAHATAPRWRDAVVAQPGVPQLVDLLIRMGPVGAIEDAVDDLDQAPEQVRLLVALVRRVEDPDLRVVAAAYLWDAAIALLESEGGAAEPQFVRDPRARQRAEALIRDARALIEAALRTDPGVANRSPFVRAVRTGGASRATARPGGAVVVLTRSTPGETRTFIERTGHPHRRYIPLLVMGAAYDTGGIHGLTGGGTLLAPLVTGAYSAPVRGVGFLGISSQYGRGPDETTYFVAAELGFGVRLGYPVGVFLGASWTPAVLRYLAPYHSTPIFGTPTSMDTDGTQLTVRGGSVKVGLDIFHFVLLAQLAILKGSYAVPGFTNWSIAVGHGF